MRSMKEVQAAVLQLTKENGRKRIAIIGAQDEEVLMAVKEAYALGVVQPILIGDAQKIHESAQKLDFPLAHVEIIDEVNSAETAKIGVKMVRNQQADMMMKGLITTKDFLKAIVNKEEGIKSNPLLSTVTVVETETIDRLILLTDCGMVIKPTLEEKIELIHNAVSLAQKLGVETPKVAALCAVEMVNKAMPDTIDAAILAKMAERKQIPHAIVDGPLALDNAISEKAAQHKGIESKVAGKADILLVPNIEAGNMMIKALMFMSHVKSGTIVVGASVPVILTSRADSAETKFHSILLATLTASR